MNILGKRSKDGTEIEELVLDTFQDGRELTQLTGLGRRFVGSHARRAAERIQFTHSAVALNPGVHFGTTLAADTARLAPVTNFCINPVQGNSGLVENLFAHAEGSLECRWTARDRPPPSRQYPKHVVISFAWGHSKRMNT